MSCGAKLWLVAPALVACLTLPTWSAAYAENLTPGSTQAAQPKTDGKQDASNELQKPDEALVDVDQRINLERRRLRPFLTICRC